jgi:hypothetical protein
MTILTHNSFGMTILEEIAQPKPLRINILGDKYPPGGYPAEEMKKETRG